MPNPQVSLLDVSRLNDAALAIQKAFNSKDPKHVEHAIEILRASVDTSASQDLQAVRADQVKLPEMNFIPSGLSWLDKMLGGGARRQELSIIAGVPHAGKTHLLSWLAAQFIIEQDFTVLHFNGEDILGDVVKIYSAMLNDSGMSKLYFADVTEHTFNANLIDGIIKKMKEDKNPPDIVVVDYMDLLVSSGGGEDWLAVSDTTKALRSIAKKHDLILFTASQLNYASPSSGRGLARLYRGKVGKASHADMIFLIDDVDGSTYYISVAKAKGRKMREKDFSLYADFDTMEIKPTH